MKFNCREHRIAPERSLRRGWVVVVWLTTVTVVGCGGAAATVEGVVTLDGKPLDQGTVTFIPVANGTGASALISSNGEFMAQTGSSAGLQPGEYVVTVRAREEPIQDPKGGLPMPGKLITPERYNTSKTSDLRATIEPGANDLKLELSSHGT